MSIQQKAIIDADPAQVYAVLADAEALSGLSGMSGTAGRSAGEEFSAFGGHVVGRQIELIPGERIIQAWRFPVWAPGTYSIVRFTLAAEGGGTCLVIDQHGEPDDWHDHVDTNWPMFYLTPLTEHFAAAQHAHPCRPVTRCCAGPGPATGTPSRNWSSRTAGSCTCTASGCSVPSTTLTTPCRKRCSPPGEASRASGRKHPYGPGCTAWPPTPA